MWVFKKKTLRNVLLSILSAKSFRKNIPLISLILVIIIAALFLTVAMGSLSLIIFVNSQEENGRDPNASIILDVIPAEGGECSNVLLFEVSGKVGTDYLRTLVGEVYSDGYWSISPDYEVYNYDGTEIRHNVVRSTGKVQTQFNIEPIELLRGFIPVTLYTSRLSFNIESPSLNFLPQHHIFFTENSFHTKYTIFHTGYTFHETLLKNSPLDSNQIYIQIPENIRNKITNLAREITREVTDPYNQIVAIRKFLQTNYVYDKNYTRAPEGWDPIEWFLFEEKRGVCTNFNSAFVALMRASGIPSRMVSGYAIKGETEYQEVYASQSHAWAEVKFEDLGWIEFDSTGPGICDCWSGTEEVERDDVTRATFTEITDVQSYAVKGHSFSVKGTVVDEDGVGVDGMVVLVHLKENKDDESGLLVVQGHVSGGNFFVSCQVPINVSIGEYNVIASAIGNQHYQGSDSDPIIKIRSETNIVLSAPQWSVNGRNFEIYGRLEEKEIGKPVSFYSVSLRIGSDQLGEIITDQEGGFKITTAIDSVGDYSIYAEFKETEYFLSSQGETIIEIYTISLNLDVPDNATRLSNIKLSGVLTAGEYPVSGEPVNIFFDSNLVSSISSDEEGKITAEYYIPESQGLGEKNVKFQLIDYPSEKTENVTVFAKSSLTLQSWKKDDNENLLLHGKLENDLKEPIREVSLQLEYTSNKNNQSIQSLTNSTGISDFEISELSNSFQGPLNYSLIFLGEGYNLPSSISGQIELDTQSNAQNIFSPFLLVIPAIAIFLGGILFLKKKRKQELFASHKTSTPKSGIIAFTKDGKPRTILEISFPQILHPFPDVWGVNEDFVVSLNLKHGDNALNRNVRLRFDNSDAKKLKTDDSGTVTHTRRIKEKGLHSIEAEFEGEGSFASSKTRRNVKIVDYTEEIVEIFNTIFESIKGKGVPLTDETTPREFQNLTIEHFKDIDIDALEDFVSVFEIANYSLHSLGRREYEQVYLAHISLQDLHVKEIEVIA